jgi:hypothetical protein
MNQGEVIMHRRLIILVVVLVVVAGLAVAAHELNLAGLLLGLNPHAPR